MENLISERDIVNKMDQMAIESLDPEDLENWERIKVNLAKVRRQLKTKMVTPEEILVNYPAYHSLENDELGQVIHAMEEHVSQKLMERDAHLKEAIDKGQKLYKALMSIHLQFGDESHAFQMSNELYNWCDFIHMNNFNYDKEAAKK